MGYNEDLARRLRAAFEAYPAETVNAVTKKKMFGGLSFLYKCKMTVSIIKKNLAVRIKDGKDHSPALSKIHGFYKRPMKEFLFISEEGFKTEEQLAHWIEPGLEHEASKLN